MSLAVSIDNGFAWRALVRGSVAAASLALAVGLAGNHPLGAGAAIGGVAVAAASSFGWPALGAVWLLALLPVCGLAPWTGWLGLEEFDLLVLATAAGGYAARAVRRPPQPELTLKPYRVSKAQQLILCLYAGLLIASLFRGIDAAGGWALGWFDGYHQPLASLRLAKPVLWLTLLAPLWWADNRAAPARQMSRVSLGMALGLGACALASICERLAFPGLLNFSTDYRTTALFWEMHVGGATLDGYLALAVPFLVRELLTAPGAKRWALAAGIAGLALYACLTTFSRGVYLMLAITLPCCIVLHHLQQRRSATAAGAYGSGAPLLAGLGLAAVAAVASAWMFPSSGYRGLMALLASLALVVVLYRPLVMLTWRQRYFAAALGVGMATLLSFASSWVPKGPYLAFAASFLAGVLFWARGLVSAGPQRSAPWLMPAVAASASTTACMVLVASHWGGDAAMTHAAPVALVLLLALFWSRPPNASRGAEPGGQGIWSTLRRQVLMLGAATAAMATVAVFGGGAYMEGRFSTGSQDMAYRLQHWRQVLSFLDSDADWWLGKGLGRYPATHLLRSRAGDNPGDHRWIPFDGSGALVLTSGNHELGFGEVYRISQHIEPPAGAATATLKLRSEKATSVHFEICEKHLLYNEACLFQTVDLPAVPGQWQTVTTRLTGVQPTRGAWYAPRQIVFSVALGSRISKVEFDDIRLVDDAGRSLLVNGDFGNGLSRWFFSSDRFHMPWHTKNLVLHVLFDQGLAGLAVWLGLVSAALWRTTVGTARKHSMAPALASALLGFLVIGLFDSLVDSARLSFLWGGVVLIALVIGDGSEDGRPRQQPVSLT